MTKKEEQEIHEGDPICEKCGTAMIEDEETGEWTCPDCTQTIDYFGDGEENSND